MATTARVAAALAAALQLACAVALAGCPDPTRASAPATSSTASTASTSASTTDDGGAGGQGGASNATDHVPCTPAETRCAAGEVCCLGAETSSCDRCSVGGACASDPKCASGYDKLACASPDQCAGDRCCAMKDPSGFGRPIVVSRCAATCTPSEVALCRNAMDCDEGMTCATTSIAGYKLCKPDGAAR